MFDCFQNDYFSKLVAEKFIIDNENGCTHDKICFIMLLSLHFYIFTPFHHTNIIGGEGGLKDIRGDISACSKV